MWRQQKKKKKSVNILCSKCNTSPGMGSKMKQRIIWSRAKKEEKGKQEKRKGKEGKKKGKDRTT